jgi:large subunit ribosomal protein L30
MVWMIIRVRGTIHAREDIRVTLAQLHLTRANHATVVPESPSFKGMLARVQGYVTWGEAEPETLQVLVQQRGRLRDGGPVPPTDGGESSLPKLTEAIASHGLVGARALRPLFRLKAPKGGWRSTKKPFALGGALGYRGKAINELARRMV